MKKSEQIIILKAKVIKLKEQLKKARLELADRDNAKPTLSQYDDAIDSLDRAFKYGISKLLEENKENFLKSDVSSLTEKYKPTSKPIESTKELFEGKGYVYFLDGAINRKCYAIGVTDKDQAVLFSTDIKDAKKYNSFEEFEKEYEGMLHSHLQYLFEPIEKEIPTYEVKLDEIYGVDNVLFTDKSQHPIFPFPPLTPPTKENIDYDYGG
jgi:hypothetical protein